VQRSAQCYAGFTVTQIALNTDLQRGRLEGSDATICEPCSGSGTGSFKTLSQRGNEDDVCLPCPANSRSTLSAAVSAEQCVCNPGFQDNRVREDIDKEIDPSISKMYSKICSPCPAGFFSQQSLSGSSTCLPCFPGSFSAEPESTSCSITKAGYYQPDDSATKQLPAPEGYYAPTTGSSLPIPCGPGTASNTLANRYCDICPSNTYAPGLANRNCTSCPAGRVTMPSASIPSSIEVCVCDVGTYAVGEDIFEGDEGSSCVSCGFFYTTDVAGATSEEDCVLHRHTAVVAIVSPVLVMGLVLLALYNNYKRKKIATMYKSAARNKLQKSMELTEEFAFPMVVIRYPTFHQLGRFVTHEYLRTTNPGALTFLDTVQEAHKFVAAGNNIVFISHQWTGWSAPDPTNVQYNTVLSLLGQIEKTLSSKGRAIGNGDNLYIWLDYTSIPQNNRGTQTLAVNSLPIYSFMSTIFLIVAPPIEHVDTKVTCDMQSYRNRMWCRAEQLSFFCKHGKDHIWFADGSMTIQQLPDEWFEAVIQVFQGDLSCCTRGHADGSICDRERLVPPLLGLFAKVYKDRFAYPEIYALLSDNKSIIFPRDYVYTCVSPDNGKIMKKTRPLFENLISEMIEYLAEQEMRTRSGFFSKFSSIETLRKKSTLISYRAPSSPARGTEKVIPRDKIVPMSGRSALNSGGLNSRHLLSAHIQTKSGVGGGQCCNLKGDPFLDSKVIANSPSSILPKAQVASMTLAPHSPELDPILSGKRFNSTKN